MKSTIIRFITPDSAFCLTQHQLDRLLDGDKSEYWYGMLDYAVYEMDAPVKPDTVSVNDTPVIDVTPIVPTIQPVEDLSAEWAQVIALFDEQAIERPKPARKTRAKAVKVENTTPNYRARVLEYVTVSGEYTPGKLRTAWKRSVYGMLFDISAHALKTTEAWKILYDVICEFDALDKDTKGRMMYAVRISNMKVADLKAECKNSGLKGYGKLKKDELVTFLCVNCNSTI